MDGLSGWDLVFLAWLAWSTVRGAWRGLSRQVVRVIHVVVGVGAIWWWSAPLERLLAGQPLSAGWPFVARWLLAAALLWWAALGVVWLCVGWPWQRWLDSSPDWTDGRSAGGHRRAWDRVAGALLGGSVAVVWLWGWLSVAACGMTLAGQRGWVPPDGWVTPGRWSRSAAWTWVQGHNLFALMPGDGAGPWAGGR